VHVLSIVLCAGGTDQRDVRTCEIVAALLQQHKALLRSLQICRVTLILLRETGYPDFYTFRDRLDYNEDAIYRHLNPPRAFMIEIGRLGVHYDIQPVTDDPILNRHVRTFLANQKKKSSLPVPNRFFVRSLVLGRALTDLADSQSFLKEDLDQMIVECCESLALSRGAVEKQTGKGVAYNRFGTLQMCNHFFLSIVPHLCMTREEAVEALKETIESNAKRLRQAGVVEVEIPFTIEEPDDSATDLARVVSGEQAPAGEFPRPVRGSNATSNPNRLPPMRMRVVFHNPSGHDVETDVYMEVFTSTQDMKLSKAMFRSILSDGKPPGALDGCDVNTPYAPIDQIELRRLMAKGKETTYCYDFIALFEKALRKQWAAYRAQESKQGGVSSWIARHTPMFGHGAVKDGGFEAKELVMSKGDKKLEEVSRPAGLNDIGMVVWRLWMQTPECPDGRTMILIANDVTVQNGSFGVREDQLFLLATQLAEKEGLPRVYVAANTGARIGLVDEVKGKFRVQWKNPLNPTSGMEFLYLDDTEVDVLRKNDMVQTELVTASDGSKRHRITAVIGPDGIGVENLRGAGTIAGSTCRAYRDIFTLTFVSGTSVGIGAYLVRLGQRAIQKGPPILLTGEAALNKVLGKKVYTSNYQLGGTQIMYNNGVTHEVVSDDLEGVSAILSWVSFVPAVKGGVLPVLRVSGNPKKLLDPIDRKIFDPRRGPNPQKIYDPRLLLTGAKDAIGKWRGGLFDKGSFRETLAGWGMTTVCGRARLGGIPMGVIVPEQRTTTLTHPADPADPDSKEKEVSQAGQVWFPDSAYKTATAIRDFNMEGLPLMIMANWRGFSGGQRDMYESILKFGSMIVEALVDYKQPVFVYIPPHGELRGGAWVVIDPTINAEQMEMYTDTTARGGILEPAGIVEIKYRHDQLLQTMARLDPEIASINIQMASATDQDRRSLADQLKARQALLLPFYQRVAEHYADLHDVPVRMTKKGCINGIVDWRHARPFFYARLRRRLAEQTALQKLHAADPESDVASRKADLEEILQAHFNESEQGGAENTGGGEEEEDKRVAALVDKNTRVADFLESASDAHREAKHPLAALVQTRAKARVRKAVADLVRQDGEAALEGFTLAVQDLSIDQRQEILNALLARMSQTWAHAGTSASRE